MLRRLILFLVLSVLAWVPAPARADASAQGSPGADDPAARELAKNKFQEGVRAFEARRYKDAVDLLLEAERAMHSPAFAYNIGIAYDAMGDTASALRWLRAYLREVPAAEDREAVAQRIGALETALQQKGVQQVTVLSTPEGATVVVDGKPLGVTPWTGELLPGKHRVEVELRGHSRAERFVDVRAHRSEDVSFELAAPSAAPGPGPLPKAPEPEPEEPTTARRGASPWPWVAFGAGALSVGGAVAFELGRASAEDEARKASQLEYREKLDVAKGRQTTARVLAGVGGALVVTGAVLLVLDRSSSSPPPVAMGCSGTGCFASAGGIF